MDPDKGVAPAGDRDEDTSRFTVVSMERLRCTEVIGRPGLLLAPAIFPDGTWIGGVGRDEILSGRELGTDETDAGVDLDCVVALDVKVVINGVKDSKSGDVAAGLEVPGTTKLWGETLDVSDELDDEDEDRVDDTPPEDAPIIVDQWPWSNFGYRE